MEELPLHYSVNTTEQVPQGAALRAQPHIAEKAPHVLQLLNYPGKYLEQVVPVCSTRHYR